MCAEYTAILWKWNSFVKLVAPMVPMGNISLAPMAVIGTIVGVNERQWRHSNGTICDIIVTVGNNDVGANVICWTPMAPALTTVPFAQFEILAPMVIITPMAQISHMALSQMV